MNKPVCYNALTNECVDNLYFKAYDNLYAKHGRNLKHLLLLDMNSLLITDPIFNQTFISVEGTFLVELVGEKDRKFTTAIARKVER